MLRERLRKNPLDVMALRELAKVLGGGLPRLSADRDARLKQAADALHQLDLETAEIILRQQLLAAPADVDALRLMAEFARQLGEPQESENILMLALELAPDRNPTRLALAGMILRQGRLDEGIAMLDAMIGGDGTEPEALRMKAAALYQAGRFAESEQLYLALIEAHDGRAELWTSYGRLLKAMGRGQDAAEAFRRAVALAPTSGVAWWSLSDLKSARFDTDDVAALQSALAGPLGDDDRLHIHFALGKALEDLAQDEAAFASYAQGNRIRRSMASYRPEAISDFVDTAEQLLDRAFFEQRREGGHAAPDPIFIVGMTRSGSTLVEQILSSHSMVEGTMELPDMPEIARSIASNMQAYLHGLTGLDREQRTALGLEYIERTRRYRKSAKPLFTDKMPNNWMHVPLILVALPNARIIDTRRHPLGCGWSNFKQHYAKGQLFTYDLVEFGRYYSDYVRMMAHIDAVQPGRVHRVFHERMVEDTDGEIRRLLHFLDLPFEQSCVEFHKSGRAVMTPSAEQVRQPINRKGVEQWLRFEPWLGPLKQALGPVLDCYPEVPANLGISR